MIRETESEIEDDAADWHARVLGGTVDWTEFADWLDAAPAHQAAYDRIAMLDAEVGAWVQTHGMPEPSGAIETPAAPAPRRWWLRGAIAASLLALAFVLPQVVSLRDGAPVVYRTAGDQRVLDLPGGGKVSLDERSQLALANDGRVRMDSGAAYFDVHHNEARPLDIQSGDFRIRDIGTKFTVTRGDGRLFVAVQQGIVDVSWRGRAPTRLQAGRAFEGDDQTGAAFVSAVDPEAVASWREGRFVYDDAPLSLVAADLSRYVGSAVVVDPSAARLRLSGVLLIRNDANLVDQISAILPVEARRGNGRIVLVGRAEQ